MRGSAVAKALDSAPRPWQASIAALERLATENQSGALAFQVGIYPLFDLVAAFISGIETYPK
jgi:hypothetical protein